MEGKETTALATLLFLAAWAGGPASGRNLFAGESCKLKDGAVGVCRSIDSCNASRQVLQQGETPVTCSYAASTPIVCCPEEISAGTDAEDTKVTEVSEATKRDSCKLNDGGGGVCRSFFSCSAALEGQRRGELPVSCSYDGRKTGVCCPLDVGAGTKATKLCEKYADAVYGQAPSPPLLLTPGVQTVRFDRCGKPHLIGGDQAAPNEFPHMAFLGFENRSEPQWSCGGSLISERYVLTAAHCFASHIGPPIVVRLGERDLSDDDEPKDKHEDFGVESVIAHPQFKGRRKYFDVGLVRLDRDAAFTASIRPACLSTGSEVTGSRAIGLTWSAFERGYGVLRKVPLSVHKGDVCVDRYTKTPSLPAGYLDDSMVCAGDLSGGKIVCQGESGGPLQTDHKTLYCMYTIIGVSSFGPQCAPPDFPAVYSRVSHYLPWIESVVWPGDA